MDTHSRDEIRKPNGQVSNARRNRQRSSGVSLINSPTLELEKKKLQKVYVHLNIIYVPDYKISGLYQGPGKKMYEEQQLIFAGAVTKLYPLWERTYESSI